MRVFLKFMINFIWPNLKWYLQDKCSNYKAWWVSQISFLERFYAERWLRSALSMNSSGGRKEVGLCRGRNAIWKAWTRFQDPPESFRDGPSLGNCLPWGKKTTSLASVLPVIGSVLPLWKNYKFGLGSSFKLRAIPKNGINWQLLATNISSR